jgi:hypothetical protein
MTMIRSLRTLAALTTHNLRASRGQAAYLIITLAITTAAWLVLATLATPYMGGKDSEGIGVIIRNGSQNSGSSPGACTADQNVAGRMIVEAASLRPFRAPRRLLPQAATESATTRSHQA